MVERGRSEVRAVLDGLDDRLLVIVGPCSIHDPVAGLEYARRLAVEADRHRDRLLVLMRTYFEKPRTTVGWKGLINDPHLDGTHDIATGLRTARRFLLDVTALGLPTATEFLEPISPQYTADLISWGAIGARTSESQIHRQLVSGLSMPVGFKNATDGDVKVALDGCSAAAAAQTFLGIDEDGRAALVSTAGNPDTHLVLRGGKSGPNYRAADVADASDRMRSGALNPRLVVDASHANSGKSHLRQAEVARELAEQIERRRFRGRRRDARELPRSRRAGPRRRHRRCRAPDVRAERDGRVHGVGRDDRACSTRWRRALSGSGRAPRPSTRPGPRRWPQTR